MSRTATSMTGTLRRQRGVTGPATLACHRPDPLAATVADGPRGPRGSLGRPANREQLTYQGLLAELLLAECDDTDWRSTLRRVNAAGFPCQNR